MLQRDEAAEAAFRDEVRTFFRESLPADLARRVRDHELISAEDTTWWQKKLYERGWFAPGWPVEWGGTGWSPLQQYLYDEEYHAAAAPLVIGFGRDLLAPVLMKYASEAQKQFYLPRILRSDDWWCQGYSEPGSGSDLASLRTRAELKGDRYVVNGQKTWTTLAQHANRMFCLVRTDSSGRKQEGITFLLIDMDTPGITVRPIRLLDGEPEVNEVWFENVEVPVANRIGEDGRAWTYAKALLGHERASIAGIGISKRELDWLWALARRVKRGGKSLAQDPRFRDRVARIETDLMALDMTNLRMLTAGGGYHPTWEISMLKLRGTEIMQAISELQLEATGLRALSDQPMPLARYLNLRKLSIFGGSNEIQRNLISQLLAG